MRNTIVSNGWNTTEWGLGFLRVSSFPLDPSCTFDTEEEFQNYLQGNDTDKPYLGLLISVNSDKYRVYVVQEYNGIEWTARPLNEDEIAELGDKINELKEKVETDLEDLESRLKGDHLTENYDTLSKILDILILHRTATAQLFQNFLDEMNKTLEGVGLDLSGSYSPDQETNYLKSATSVMNALRILDRLIYKLNFVYEDTNTVLLVPTYDEDTGVTTFTANVKISSEDRNLILAKEDGLYHMSKLAYSNGILTHTVNGKVVSTHDIGISGLVEESYYDVTTEKIVIIFKLHSGESQRVEIPASNLIEEWAVLNPDNSPVELTRTRVVNGKDELSADIRLSEKPNNILTKDGNTLYVKGTTDNILHNGEVLKEVIDKFLEKPYVFNSYQEAVDANLPIGETFLLSQTEEVPIDFLVPHDGYIIWAEDETWWSQLYLYLFDSSGLWITAWPGDIFTGSFKINDTYYKYWDLGNIEEGKVLSSIFSNGSGTQFDGPSITVNKNYYLKLTNNSFEIIDDLKTTTYYLGLYVVTENGFKALSLDEELKENLEGLVVRVDDLDQKIDNLSLRIEEEIGTLETTLTTKIEDKTKNLQIGVLGTEADIDFKKDFAVAMNDGSIYIVKDIDWNTVGTTGWPKSSSQHRIDFSYENTIFRNDLWYDMNRPKFNRVLSLGNTVAVKNYIYWGGYFENPDVIRNIIGSDGKPLKLLLGGTSMNVNFPLSGLDLSEMGHHLKGFTVNPNTTIKFGPNNWVAYNTKFPCDKKWGELEFTGDGVPDKTILYNVSVGGNSKFVFHCCNLPDLRRIKITFDLVRDDVEYWPFDGCIFKTLPTVEDRGTTEDWINYSWTKLLKETSFIRNIHHNPEMGEDYIVDLTVFDFSNVEYFSNLTGGTTLRGIKIALPKLKRTSEGYLVKGLKTIIITELGTLEDGCNCMLGPLKDNNLQSLTINMENVINTTNMFARLDAKDTPDDAKFTGFPECNYLHLEKLKTSTDISEFPNCSLESIKFIFDSALDVTSNPLTLTIFKGLYDIIPQEWIASFEAKGWSIATKTETWLEESFKYGTFTKQETETVILLQQKDLSDSILGLKTKKYYLGSDVATANSILFANNNVDNVDLIYNIADASNASSKSMTARINSATTTNAGVMTAADKQVLDELCLLTYSANTAVTVSGSTTNVERGVNNDITFTWDAKFNNTSVTPNSVSVKKGSTIVSTDVTAKTYSDTISETTTYSAEIVYRGVTKTASRTYNAYYPKYYGGSSKATITADDVITLAKLSITSSANGTYSITSENDLYIWFCIPSNMNITKVTLGGFAVPLEAPITLAVTGKGNYKCYRSSNPLSEGTRNFVIS